MIKRSSLCNYVNVFTPSKIFFIARVMKYERFNLRYYIHVLCDFGIIIYTVQLNVWKYDKLDCILQLYAFLLFHLCPESPVTLL